VFSYKGRLQINGHVQKSIHCTQEEKLGISQVKVWHKRESKEQSNTANYTWYIIGGSNEDDANMQSLSKTENMVK
jgi:hypothetical protein